jgi:hypothetical protein
MYGVGERHNNDETTQIFCQRAKKVGKKFFFFMKAAAG